MLTCFTGSACGGGRYVLRESWGRITCERLPAAA
jgi:hypothetical protein